MTTITVPVLGTAHDAATFRPLELTSADLFVCAYTDGMFGYSTDTIRAVHDAGKGVLPNHERGVTDLGGGYGAGTVAASQALAVVRGQWAAPRDGTVAVVYSVDASVAPSTFPVYVPAFQAIRAYHGGEYLVGFYGELALYKYLKARGLVDVRCWLSASSSFPGYDPNDSDVGLIQLVGTDIPGTDRNLITSFDLGVWWPAGHHPSGGGTIIEEPEEDDDMLQPFGIYHVQFKGTPQQVSWIVALDWSSKTHIVDADQDRICATLADPATEGGPWYKTMAMTDAQVATIPEATPEA